MKITMVLLPLVVFLTTSPLFAEENGFGKHVAASAALQGGCELIYKVVSPKTNTIVRALGCFVVTNGVGVIKEVSDPSFGRHREMSDIYGNALGSGMSLVILRAVW